MKKIKGTFTIAMCILFTFAITAVNTPIAHGFPALNLTVKTNKQSYYLREKVEIYGNLTINGSPVQDELMALEVDDIYGAIIFRTLQTGTTPITGDFEIVSIGTYKEVAPYTWVPTDTFEVGSEAWFNVTVKNVGTVTKSATTALSIYEGNNIPIGVGAESRNILPNSSAWSLRSIIIPTWAYIGTGTAYASVFTDIPPSGVPYCSEKSATFNIARAGSGGGSGTSLGTKLDSNPAYNSTFRLSPEPWPGTYRVYASSSHQGEQTTASTTFQVLDAHYPPQASFTYSPPFPYMYQTVTFDASGSTAEGYGDYIVSYEWDFGDGTPKVNETDPITTHKYTLNGTYTVTLNVTDNEGLWCTTSKQIRISPIFGPTAIFTYSPAKPIVNATTFFNATLSQPGYNGTHVMPIVNYVWNFSDGENGTGVTTTHIFATEGSYNVTLNVTDAQGLWDTTTQTINVTIPTEIHDVAVTNVTRSNDQAYSSWIPPINITVTVKNLGDFSENFTVTVYCRNATGTYPIGTTSITNLLPGENTTLTFNWYLTKVFPCNYTILAEALLPGDIKPGNNILIDGTVTVRKPGDANGDGQVRGDDLGILGASWYQSEGDPNYDPRADFNGDGTVKGDDLGILGANWYT